MGYLSGALWDFEMGLKGQHQPDADTIGPTMAQLRHFYGDYMEYNGCIPDLWHVHLEACWAHFTNTLSAYQVLEADM